MVTNMCKVLLANADIYAIAKQVQQLMNTHRRRKMRGTGPISLCSMVVRRSGACGMNTGRKQQITPGI